MKAATEQHVKVLFHLEKDESDYPPQEWEGVWTVDVGNERYKIDNVPFFAKGVSWGDVITVRETGDELHFDEVEDYSRHSTVRLLIHDIAAVRRVRSELILLGCSSELSHIPGLVAVDIPPSANLDKVRTFLDRGEKKGIFEYEEAAVWW